jgi:hypothetical protein
MPELEETENTWRKRQIDPDKFEKFRVKEITEGIKFVYGKYKGKDEWDVQSIIFDKDKFKTKDEVTKWLKEHNFKASITENDKRWLSELEEEERMRIHTIPIWYGNNL